MVTITKYITLLLVITAFIACSEEEEIKLFSSSEQLALTFGSTSSPYG
jgi:hypothetical protein